ncbi:hypothetical protein HB904_07470 [Listeria booriae]|uniref:Uncharacterized protein n=1 Tax=Listeria booriae TaxID=1552123 RepID=A0A841YNZ6_9LIST|nr:hypothetical protein [Listeria booriae]MBC1402452.1 hypothetical protein [Listeria booriae]MBC1616020.1 hypothetical protein [Listeria booriae]
MQPRRRKEELWAEQIKKERKFEELEQLFSKTKRAQEGVLHLFQDAWKGSKSQWRLGMIEDTMTEEWQKRKKQMFAVDDALKESRRAYQREQFASKEAGINATD